MSSRTYIQQLCLYIYLCILLSSSFHWNSLNLFVVTSWDSLNLTLPTLFLLSVLGWCWQRGRIFQGTSSIPCKGWSDNEVFVWRRLGETTSGKMLIKNLIRHMWSFFSCSFSWTLEVTYHVVLVHTGERSSSQFCPPYGPLQVRFYVLT